MLIFCRFHFLCLLCFTLLLNNWYFALVRVTVLAFVYWWYLFTDIVAAFCVFNKVTKVYWIPDVIIIRRNRFRLLLHISLSVCLSVCRTRAPCLNRSTDLDAIWQVHLWGPMTHCVRWGPWPSGKRRFGRSNSQPKHAIANCSQPVGPMLPPRECKRVVGPQWFRLLPSNPRAVLSLERWYTRCGKIK